MRSNSSMKRLFGRWNVGDIKFVRRVIVSVVGATVLLIGIALLVLPGPAFVVIPLGLAILATEYAWARRWLKKARRIASDLVSGRERAAIRDLVSSCHRVIAASTKNAQPSAPRTRLTTQNGRFFVSAEIATIAIAIWNTVTPRAKESLPCRIALTLLAVRYASDELRAEHAHGPFNLTQWTVSLLVRRRHLAR
jgi:uncharacterized protein (TIGR02611 family)